LGFKLLRLAQASSQGPSTVKGSLDNSCGPRARARTCAKKAWATSPASKRSRFLVKTVGSQTGSSSVRPTNQRNPRL
jgi:hypothetical protein